MRLRRITPVVLAAILLTGGLTSGFRLAGRPKSVAGVAPIPASLPVRTAPREAWSPEKIRSPERLAATLDARPAEVATLSGDAAALVVEICDLQLLAQGTDLELTSEQWTALAGVTLNIQAIRQGYEAQIATGSTLAPGRFRVEIPAYAGAGDVLREKFYGSLRRELGEAKASLVLVKLGSRLEGHFAGFGVSLQTLDIIAGPGGGLADCEVTRTARFWNSVEGKDRLSTRRETHFPRGDDAGGDGWNALLAVVGLGSS